MMAERGVVDAAAANLAAARWVRGVANARLHATTSRVAAERLAEERTSLRPVLRPYPCRKLPTTAAPAPRATQQPIVGLPQPLPVYDRLMLPAASWVEVLA